MPECEICHATFSTEKGVIMHKAQKHKSEKKSRACQYCSKELSRIFFLNKHESICKSNPANKREAATSVSTSTQNIINSNVNCNNNNNVINNNYTTLVFTKETKAEILQKLVPITDHLLTSIAAKAIEKKKGIILNGAELSSAMMDEGLKYSMVLADVARDKLLWRDGDYDNKIEPDIKGRKLAKKALQNSSKLFVNMSEQAKNDYNEDMKTCTLDQVDDVKEFFHKRIHQCAQLGHCKEPALESYCDGLIEKAQTYSKFHSEQEENEVKEKYRINTVDSVPFQHNRAFCKEIFKILTQQLLTHSAYHCGRIIIQKCGSSVEFVFSSSQYYYYEGKEKVKITQEELSNCWKSALEALLKSEPYAFARLFTFMSNQKKDSAKQHFMTHLQILLYHDYSQESYFEQLFRGFMGLPAEDDEEKSDDSE